RADPAPGPYRVHRMPIWNPPSWTSTPSGRRVDEFVRWERATIQPKYALPFGTEYTLSEGTTELYDYWWFFGAFFRKLDARLAARLPGTRAGQPIVYYPRRGYDLWNSRYFILPAVPRWDDEHRGIASFQFEVEPILDRK